MKYKELTKEQAHNMTITGIENIEGTVLELEKKSIMEGIDILSKYGFSMTSAVYKNAKCSGYCIGEDILLENYKDIKKWLLSLGYRVSLFPPAFVPCEQHFLTVEWG